MPLSKEPADMTLPELAQAMWGKRREILDYSRVAKA